MDHNNNFTISPARAIWMIMGVLIALLALVVETNGQSADGFLYGRVHTDDNVYQGVLRWGSEEILWVDHFNAAKSKNDYYQKFETEKKENSDWFSFDWRFSSIWENKSTVFQFTCQFGDIKQIRPSRNDDIYLTFRNGVEIKLNGSGYNDIGTSVRVYDEELGNILVNWNKITKIEFNQAPTNYKFTETALYATVETVRKGTFKGFIAWDKDERIGGDKLNGKSRDGEVAISFSDIQSIERKYDGSEVVLKSGREIFVEGSNDVNSDNRGIVVFVDGVGAVEIPWREFRKITFTQSTMSIDYNSFGTAKMLSGKVLTYDDKQLAGKLIYDVDETWDLEMVEGNDDEVKYVIPLRNIKSVRPKNFSYSSITLRNGDTILIGGSRDVSADNAGIVVISRGTDKQEHISWRKINEIIFD